VIGAPGESYKLIFRSEHMTPRIALLDPELCVTAPPRVTAASGFDAVTHAVEAYTSNMAGPLTDPLALAAMSALAVGLPLSYAEPGNVGARAACLVGSMQAAMAFNSANLGLAHAIAGALGALHHTPHGLANALALPWTMAFNRPALGAKDGVIAQVFGSASAATGLAKLRAALALNVGLDEVIGADADLDALAEAASRSGQIWANPRPASVADIRAILEAMRTPTANAERPHGRVGGAPATYIAQAAE
jgi:alcohol dehydrogenase